MIEPSVDARLGRNFVTNVLNGKNRGFIYKFLPTEMYYILDSKVSEKKRDKITGAYIKYMYGTHRAEMEKGVRTAGADWAKVEKQYFRLVDRLFKNHPWPEGKYIGFSTVWHSYPRNVSDKTFYFPYRHSSPKYANNVIAHELLHFMFFDYTREKYGLKEGSLLPGKPKNYLWTISEAFNNVIEEWAPYKKIFKHGARTHQGVEEIFAKMNKQWKKKQDVAWLLDKWLKPKR